MMVLVDDCDTGVGDLHASDLPWLTLGRGASAWTERPHGLSANWDEIQSATCFHKRNPGSSRSPQS